jgi:hypothetical protein
MVNHLPLAVGSGDQKGVHLEQQLQGLNRVIGAEFSGVASFPYWDHVGMVGMGSGVYLGDGYVLTSAHVGCYPFRAHDGSYYEPDYKSWQILKNADGSKSDLAVFSVSFEKSSRLAKLGHLPIGSEESRGNRPVLLMGTGFTQNEQPATFSSGGKVLAVLSYQVQPQRSMAWGINRASQAIEQPVATGKDLSTRCFTTRFERTNFAGQAADGDSGGAAFSYNRELARWELVGCIIAVSQQRSVVTFGSSTYLGDLRSYASQLPGAVGLPIANAAPSFPENAAAIQARPTAIR